MKDIKYTPGPWACEAFDTGEVYVHNSEDVVCDISGIGPTSDANARLVTAAPDLLQALQAIAECDGDTVAGRCARDTLAKAGL